MSHPMSRLPTPEPDRRSFFPRFPRALPLQVNAIAHFWTIKAFIPEMAANNHGHLVTIASSAGLVAVDGLADYCASKAGA